MEEMDRIWIVSACRREVDEDEQVEVWPAMAFKDAAKASEWVNQKNAEEGAFLYRLQWSCLLDVDMASSPARNPSHYERGGLRCDQVMGAMLSHEEQIGYWYGCAMKYVWRWPSKYEDKDHQIEDIDKAIECLTRLKALVLAAALEESEDK